MVDYNADSSTMLIRITGDDVGFVGNFAQIKQKFKESRRQLRSHIAPRILALSARVWLTWRFLPR